MGGILTVNKKTNLRSSKPFERFIIPLDSIPAKNRETWEISVSAVKLGSHLGEGGFAAVRRAWLSARPTTSEEGGVHLEEVGPPLECAVKILKQNVKRDACEDFVTEIVVNSNLSHPRIVTFMCACPLSPTPFIVTEIMGPSVRSVLDGLDQKSVKVSSMLQVALDLLAAVIYLHLSCYVHRDINSSNILLDRVNLGRVKLGDLGLCRHFDNPPVSPNIGAPQYMAPEIFNGNECSSAVDCYAVGIVVWELVTTEAEAYPGLIPPQIFMGVASGSRPALDRPPFSDNGEAGRGLATALSRCWDADPQKRPRAEEIKLLLEENLGGLVRQQQQSQKAECETGGGGGGGNSGEGTGSRIPGRGGGGVPIEKLQSFVDFFRN